MRLVVYCTAAERRVLRCAGRRLRHEAAFAADASGLAAFQAYLQGRRGAEATLVIDVAGEEYHEEQVPLLRGRDRDTVLRRRLAQRFPEARLAAAYSLGRADAGSRKERLLLASWANERQFAPWLDALKAARVRLAGVHSTALLAPALAPPEARHALQGIVASVHAQGLRLCLLERGRLRFARFEALPAASSDECAARVRAETGRLADYVLTLRAPLAHALPLSVIAPAGQRAAFERAFAAEARFALRFEALETAARRLGLSEAPPELGAERLALWIAARRPPREQFAQAEDRADFVQSRLRRALAGAGALGFAACAAYAGVQGFDAIHLREEAREVRREALEAKQRYERRAAQFPAAPTSAENLELTVREMRRIAARSALPEAALTQVSVAFDRCPQLTLETLGWSVGPLAAPETAPRGDLAERIELTGHVAAAPADDVRAVDAGLRCLAMALQTMAGWRVLRSQPSSDTTTQGALRDGVAAAAPGAPRRFSLAASRPLE